MARYEMISPLLRLRPGQAQNLRSILGEALLDSSGGEGGQRYLYGLPLWPKFIFSVSLDDSGQFIGKAEFVRKGDSRAEDRIEAWDFVEADLVDAFDNIQEIDGWGHYVTYIAQDLGRSNRYFLRFGWGLLQEMEMV